MWLAELLESIEKPNKESLIVEPAKMRTEIEDIKKNMVDIKGTDSKNGRNYLRLGLGSNL